jgi:hypothetical protein
MWCKNCGYALDGLSENRCPECGRGFDPNDNTTFEEYDLVTVRRAFRWRKTKRLTAIIASSVVYCGAGSMMGASYGITGPVVVSAACIFFTALATRSVRFSVLSLISMYATEFVLVLYQRQQRQLFPSPIERIFDGKTEYWLIPLGLIALGVIVVRLLPAESPVIAKRRHTGSLFTGKQRIVMGIALLLTHILFVYWAQIAEWPLARKLRRNPNLVVNSHRWTPTFYHTLSALLAQAVAVPPPSTIGSVKCEPQAMDTDLSLLIGLKNLSALEVCGSRITDAGLKHIGKMMTLRRLDLEGSQITDGALVQVKKLRNLFSLLLNSENITDEGMAYLAGMTNLESLDLSDTSITDEGLNHLIGLNKLVELDVPLKALEGNGLSYIQRLTSLEYLTVENTQNFPLRHMTHAEVAEWVDDMVRSRDKQKNNRR